MKELCRAEHIPDWEKSIVSFYRKLMNLDQDFIT
jgi:hypothetical protein